MKIKANITLYVRLLIIFLTFFLPSSFAYSQDYQPGDSCTVADDGRYMLSGGPELSGVGYMLVCDGTQWLKVFSFDRDSFFRPQFVNQNSCQNGEVLTYHSASGGLHCDPCSLDPAPGEACSDGTYFLGDIGAGPVYATDATFQGNETWNDGNTNYSTTGATSVTDGEANTAILVTEDSDDVTAGVQPHEAAIYCDNLSVTSRKVVWLLPEQLRLEFVPVLHRLQGRPAA
ncbi:hypothetical protein, partial [Roseovarius sp. MBR-6]|uniref:hypothetical protein n=1 Tax=Roseovarius sp. MBR-6 TaxID=3156459 RepID=UPI003397F3DD